MCYDDRSPFRHDIKHWKMFHVMLGAGEYSWDTARMKSSVEPTPIFELLFLLVCWLFFIFYVFSFGRFFFSCFFLLVSQCITVCVCVCVTGIPDERPFNCLNNGVVLKDCH